MEHLVNELARTRRELRNWRYFSAVAVMLATVAVIMAAIPHAMN